MENTTPFNGIYFELFDVSMTLCRSHNMTPFDLFKQNTDEVIMLINYYIEKSEIKGATTINRGNKREERIRVNDKTATGGWY